MARFYARFDTGSVGSLDTINADGCFTRLRIGAGSASGALLRNGLIASRSALSADIYADLDPVNIDGSRGVYFPPDSGPFSTDVSTFVSWSSAYTSSVAGVIIPSDYRNRPTGSILSTQTTLVNPTTPLDPVGASYTTYNNASAAVRAVLDVIQTTAAVVTTPFTRVGQNESRTLHSIWHDQDLQYFAWDDFTPGEFSMSASINSSQVSGSVLEVFPGGTPVNTNVVFLYNLATYQFPNDINPTGQIGINLTLTDNADINVAALQLNGGTHGGPLSNTTNSSGNGPTNPRQGGSSTWTWDAGTKQLQWSIGLVAGRYKFYGNAFLYDATITTHQSSYSTSGFSLTPTNNIFDVKDGDPL